MPNSEQTILIVGAGFAGAVHARLLAENGYKVQVIDKRNHLGGNAFDYVDPNGIRVHAYGPHLFHTKMPRVIEWVRRFGNFLPYEHKVRALLPSNKTAPLPINRETINAVFNQSFETAEETESFVNSLALPIAKPANAAEYLYSRIGRTLTDLFFRPYTKKMWAFELEDMAASVVQRIPINFDDIDTYFTRDDIQMMPEAGYSNLFENIFDHGSISICLNTAFDKSLLKGYTYCFNSMPIDEYFEFSNGELPYRSIRFHHRTTSDVAEQKWSVTNFTDNSPFTRETAWHAIPNHIMVETYRRTLTKEEPCDYRDNGYERYYPVKTADGRYQKMYEHYKTAAKLEADKISFIGRCGTYQYLDMDQVINQSLTHATAWIQSRA